jgi:hypothetical protein
MTSLVNAVNWMRENIMKIHQNKPKKNLQISAHHRHFAKMNHLPLIKNDDVLIYRMHQIHTQPHPSNGLPLRQRQEPPDEPAAFVLARENYPRDTASECRAKRCEVESVGKHRGGVVIEPHKRMKSDDN